MALPTSSFLSFLGGILILAYLSTFVAFAILRILTGISIQRLWGFGLRHLSYTPRDGFRIDIRGLGFSLHRPTFARPTWISVVVSELKITIDLKALGSKRIKQSAWTRWTNGGLTSPPASPSVRAHDPDAESEADTEEIDALEPETDATRTWERLTQLKERVKRLHSKIWWIRWFDIIATNSSLLVVDVCEFQLSSFSIAIDTRKKTIDRGRLFQHRKSPDEDYRRPAEWIMTARSLLFSIDGDDFNEFLDNANLNIHGMLSQKKEGLRDASIALKLGRLSIPVDDLQTCMQRVRSWRNPSHSRTSSRASHVDASFLDLLEAPDEPGSPKDEFSKAVADSRHFVSSILKGIQEVQFAIGYVGLSKKVESLRSKGAPIYVNLSMKEVGMDLLRLDARSPAHLTYFSKTDIAHQALLTAISISVGIDDGHEHPERLLYIPLGTATLKTTLPSKALQLAKEKNFDSRDSNILFANLVITSPSVDLDPKHLPLTLAMLETWRERSSSSGGSRRSNHRLISKLLPKSNIKISIHEPVVRVSLPCMEVERRGTGEYDLLISAMSSISLDLESSHAATGDLHYTIAGGYRIASHQLYYQTAAGEKYNLLLTDSFEVKVSLSADPNVSVSASINAQTFNLYLTRPEISEGVRQIVVQLHKDVYRRRQQSAGLQATKRSFLRRMPIWLRSIRCEGSDFNLEVAGIDAGISDQAKGISVHLENWTADYKVDRASEIAQKQTRRRTMSRSYQGDDVFTRQISRSPSKNVLLSSSDGRRLAIHTYGLEAFVIEATDAWESEPFMSLPRFELAVTTFTDQQGPIQHINSFAKYAYFHYSLYRHFAVSIATSVLRKTFSKPRSEQLAAPQHGRSRSEDLRPVSPMTLSRTEITTVDFKASLIQIKADTPANPKLMLQIFSVEAGQHRWASPFLKAQLVRLYAEAPNVKKAWSRIITARNMRCDYRSSRRKQGVTLIEERSIDVATDAIRCAVPHQLVMHKIFDNVTNIVKTVEQLNHRFKTGGSEYNTKKEPQEPKKVPKISFRSHAVLFEIEDSSFEWKLGLIHVQGLHEQKQRQAREDAFQLKKRKIQEMEASMASRRDNHEARERRGWHFRGRYKQQQSTDDVTESKRRSKSAGDVQRPLSPSRRSSRRLRYDTEGRSALTEHAQRSIKDAEETLHKFDARSWKRRIDRAYKAQQDRMRDIHTAIWGHDEIPEGIEQKEKLMGIPQRPALFAVMVHDFAINIDKPSFALHDYANFLHSKGKGMPRDMKYSLLIPMHVNITMRDARATLRDYPLPLVHIPRPRADQSGKPQAVLLSTDFVIAEEYRDDESIRFAKVVVVPPTRDASGERSKGLSVNIRRTVGSVKTYSDITVDINTASATRITWGASYQPAIQDMMQVIEGFMKPAVDPSQRVGFWDKIRLAFHSRINIAWKAQGDVHFVLKGSRDPYLVTGVGAGFVMCWRNDVRWALCQTDDPKKFMTVNSGEYVLAVPDFAHFARRSLDGANVENSNHASAVGVEQGGKFKKTVMKLSGKVLWLAGIVFERNTKDGRSFNFKHHYDVVLKNPKYATSTEPGEDYDAFRGFRSHHIHLSIAIAAPVDRDWSVTNLKPSSNYNSVHLTPRFFSHFFSWWSMFSGNMSLPIRQGKLWPGVDKTSKKFGRHLATIKYNLLLSPLFLSHIYKYKGPDNQGQTSIFASGLKVKLDSFMLDLHQRREVFRKFMPGNRQVQTSGVRINKAQLDFISADFRAVSAVMKEPTINDLDETSDEQLTALSDHLPRAQLGNFFIPDRDTGWVDMDDFVELDWILPMETTPETQILPLAYAPRFTYFRQTDHHNIISGDPNRSSPFGNEDTHYCVMSARNDPRRVQCDLIQGRLDRIAEQIARHKHSIGEFELKVVRDASPPEKIKSDLEQMQNNHDILLRKQAFLQDMHKNLIRRLEDNDMFTPADSRREEFYEAKEEYEANDTEGLENIPFTEDISDFNNRFIVHNAQLKWSNPLRDIILRYVHQVSQRRGFVYYMSRPAVKFILDIVEEQHKARESTSRSSVHQTTEPVTPLTAMPVLDKMKDEETQGFIDKLLQDGKRFVEAKDDSHDDLKDKGPQSPVPGGNIEEIPHEFTAQNAYHVRLIAPQIQLQSEKNTKSAVLITSKGIQLKVVQIMDKDRVTDEVSGLVQRRFNANMDSVQVFVTSNETFKEDLLDLYSANRFGAPSGSSWPPWVPLEDMFDFHVDPYGFSRVVQRTSASMQYNKYNTLRLKYNDDITTHQLDGGDADAESGIDHISVDFPQLLTKCDSTQYFALYLIVLDLIIFSEPQEKTREEKLEKIMLASDFTDLSEAPLMVTKLQSKIRILQEIKLMFQLHESTLTRQQWKERIVLEDDLAKREDELFFIMKAITTSQSQIAERIMSDSPTSNLKWDIVAKELVWHMVYKATEKVEQESLIELQLKNAQYLRVDYSDGSNDNAIEVGKIEGWTLLKDANYPQLIAPFEEENKKALPQNDSLVSQPMVRVHWYMLEAIAGIVIMDKFEVAIVPLKVQVEYETGHALAQYIFPNMNKGKENKEGKASGPLGVKNLLSTHAEEDEDQPSPTTDNSPLHSSQHLSVPNDSLTGAGELELRLQPTLTLRDSARPPKSPRRDKRPQGGHSDFLRPKHFGNHNDGHELRRLLGRRKNTSTENLSSVNRSALSRTTSGISEPNRSAEAPKRFGLLRANSTTNLGKKAARSNDVTEMMDRASKYMTLTYVNVASMVLCLTYKNKGQRNLVTDVHDLVFRLPMLEYRNKTWSNFDLFKHLQKEVVKALFAHSGAILGNMFTHHRSSKQQQSRLREMANSSIILGGRLNAGSSKTLLGHEKHKQANDKAGSQLRFDEGDELSDDDASGYHSPSHPRSSFVSERESVDSHDELPTTSSSSVRSGMAQSQKLALTPIKKANPRAHHVANGNGSLRQGDGSPQSKSRTLNNTISRLSGSFAQGRPSSVMSSDSAYATPLKSPSPAAANEKSPRETSRGLSLRRLTRRPRSRSRERDHSEEALERIESDEEQVDEKHERRKDRPLLGRFLASKSQK